MATPSTPSRLRSISLMVNSSLVHRDFSFSSYTFWAFKLLCAEVAFASSRHSSLSEQIVRFTYASFLSREVDCRQYELGQVRAILAQRSGSQRVASTNFRC